jgi:hypothetical protein
MVRGGRNIEQRRVVRTLRRRDCEKGRLLEVVKSEDPKESFLMMWVKNRVVRNVLGATAGKLGGCDELPRKNAC